MTQQPTHNPNSSEYLPQNHEVKEFTPEELAAMADLHGAWNDTLYGAKSGNGPHSEEERQELGDTARENGVDLDAVEHLMGAEVNPDSSVLIHTVAEDAEKIAVLANEALDQHLDLTPPEVGVTTAEAYQIALGKGEEDEDSRKGVRIALAKEFCLRLEQGSSEQKAELLQRFRYPEDAQKIAQRVHELQEQYGTVENATANELNELGELIENAPTIDIEASEVVVTEETDGTIHVGDEAELIKQREAALVEARSLAK